MKSLEHHIILHLKSSQRTMDPNATSGLVVLSHTSYSREFHHSMVHLIRKSWRKSSLVSSLSRMLSGVMSPMMLRTSSLNYSRKIKIRDHRQNRLFNIHGSLRYRNYRKLTWTLMWQYLLWKIFKASMLRLNLSKLHTLSLHLSYCPSRRRPISIKFSELWM